MYTTKSRNSSSPRIKWEVLLVGIVVIAIAIAMLVLCFFRELMDGFPLPLVAVVAYGWPVGLFAGAFSVSAIIEDFLPSYKRYKAFKHKEEYKVAVKKTVAKSLRSNERKAYKDFLEANPKYMA